MQILGADAVVKVIQEQGIKEIFGYPGGAIMPVYDAIYRHGLLHYLCRHEQGAGFAALGGARASGQVGVCIATSGPGATNLVTALADAMMDSVPMVAITGQVPQAVIGTDAFQEIDVLGMSLAVTKHSFMVESAQELVPTLRKAFEVAISGRPGPVLVDIPKNIQVAQLEYEPAAKVEALAELKEVTPQTIDEAYQLINQAKRPVLYVGGGVALSGAVQQVRELAATLQIPSVCTLKGIGSMAGAPHYLGMLGMHGTGAANIAVQESDLLIAVGARFDDRVTGKLDEFAPHAKIIHIEVDAAELHKIRRAHVAINADAKSAAKALMQDAKRLDIDPWRARTTELATQHAFTYPSSQTIHAPKLLNLLSQKAGDNAVVSCDVGQHQMWVAQHMQFSHPNNHLSSSGLGTMGFGLPAAIGAQVARPDDTVITVSGDGSIMMNIQELATINRFNLPVKVVILDNSRLGMVKQWQQLFFEGRYSETDLSDNPEFTELAKVFNIATKRITQQSEVESAIDEMLAHQGAYLLHVCIPVQENVWPLVPPGAANDKMMEQA